MSDPQPFLTLALEALSDAPLMVDAAYGREAISEMFSYRVFVRVPAHKEVRVIGETATFTAWPPDADSDSWWRFDVHGIVSECRLVTAVGVDGDEPTCLYELTLVPRMFPLSLGRLSRVFVDQTVIDIAKLLCDPHVGDAVTFEEQGSYEPREHVCQYRESRWNFLNRILEREGLFYRFAHTDDADQMCIIDDHEGWNALRSDDAAIPYRAGGADTSMLGSDCIWSASRHERVLPGTMILGDNDYLHPDVNQRENKFDIDVLPSTEVHFGDDGRRGTKPLAKDMQLRIERQQIARETTIFQGSARGVRAGYPMVLDGHPTDSLNQKYLVTRARFFFHQRHLPKRIMRKLPAEYRELAESAASEDGEPKRYNVEFEAVPHSLPYRPARQTKAPNIRGFTRAIVDGASEDSDYAQIDEHGRYQVRFMFDFDDRECDPGQGSAYLRMMQPHAGDIEGFHFPLRRNTEVMVAFVDGNPDRPVIAGSVPNAISPSPVTDKNHTQNVIKTGGKNHITFEDKEGKEWIFAGSPNKDSFLKLGLHPDESAHVRMHTDASSAFSFGGDWTVDVGKNLIEKVAGNMDQRVKGPVYEFYDNIKQEDVTGFLTENFHGGQSTTVMGGDRTMHIYGMEDREATVSWKVKTPISTMHATSTATIRTPSMSMLATTYKRRSNTTDIDAGNVGYKSGVTYAKVDLLTGDFGPVLLNAGPTIINTPSWTINVPSEKEFISAKHSWADIKTGGAKLNIALHTLYLAHTSIKIDICTAKIANVPLTAESGSLLAKAMDLISFA